MNLKKSIPLLVATGLSIFSIFLTAFNNLIQNEYEYLYSKEILYGVIALSIVWVSKFLHSKVWVYLFLFLLFVSFSDIIDFTEFKLSFSIGSLYINIISLTLTLSHFALNADLFKIPEKTEEEMMNESKEKVNRFVKKFESRSRYELENMLKNKLVPEAKEAIQQLLNAENSVQE